MRPTSVLAAAAASMLLGQVFSQGQGYDPVTMTHANAPAVAAAGQPAGGPAALAFRLLGADVSTDDVVEIDTTNATFKLLGKLGDDIVAGYAWDLPNRRLYGTSTRTNNLLSIEPTTGKTTVIGPLGTTLMHGCTFDLRTGTIYGANSFSASKELFKINPATGAATPIGPTGLGAVGVIAFDPVKNVLYAADITTRSLYTLNTSTGAATLVGPFGTGTQIGVGLAFDLALGLFATDNLASNGADDTLYKIDTTTGKATLIGALKTGNCLSLAFLDCAKAESNVYGSGFACKNGIATLTSNTIPMVGQPIMLSLSNTVGSSAPGLLLFSPLKASIPGWWGGTFLVDLPTALWFPVTVPASGFQLNATIPQNASCGVPLYVQAFLIDPSLSQLLCNTAGLELILGV
jgi:DNA-binding beta-propeller fold protein YncE